VDHLRRYLFVSGLLTVLLVAIYSNTFSVSWKFDDLPNIVNNAPLHLQRLDPDSLLQTLSAHPNGQTGLYRPAACLSFALNWYFGQDRVFGYHVVNLSVHLGTAIFLYLTLVTLYQSPMLAHRHEHRSVHSIALLAAILWAANPVQTQAVNYIVQRMATLAAFFSLVAIFMFVKARLSCSEYRRGAYYVACGGAYLFATASKENAAILPLSLILTEVVFFQGQKKFWKNKYLLGGILLSAGTVFCVAYVFYDVNPLLFGGGFGGRPFSLSERLLTEARIVVFYLSQLFYPHPDRLSLVHDFAISRGLLQPWTTLASIFLIAAMIGMSLLRMRKNPVVAFACLFFFLNHLVESTVVPLELVFEHRNYLPSLFLFWPVAAGFHHLQVRFRDRRWLAYAAPAGAALVLVSFGLATYQRNEIWTSDKIFWQDAQKKAPQYKRPYQQLASYYQKKGQLDKAVALLEQSKNYKDENPGVGRIVYYNNMGDIRAQQGRYEDAIDYLETLLAAEPDHRIGRGNLIVALMKSGRWAEASEHIDFLLKKRYDNYRYPNLKGLVLLQLNQIPEAYRYFEKALYMAPLARDTLVNFCTTISLKGEYDRAHTCLTRAMRFYPDDRSLLIRLAENQVRSGNPREARRYLNRLRSLSERSLSQVLAEEADDVFLVPPAEFLMSMAAGGAAHLDQELGKLEIPGSAE